MAPPRVKFELMAGRTNVWNCHRIRDNVWLGQISITHDEKELGFKTPCDQECNARELLDVGLFMLQRIKAGVNGL